MMMMVVLGLQSEALSSESPTGTNVTWYCLESSSSFSHSMCVSLRRKRESGEGTLQGSVFFT